MNRSRSEIFSPNENNIGGLITVSTQLHKHKAAVYDARPRINSLAKPHPHVDQKGYSLRNQYSRPSSAQGDDYGYSTTDYNRKQLHMSSSQDRINFGAQQGFQPILTRKNKKQDKYTFNEHENNLRDLKLKINSIKRGNNVVERKKNPFDTSVHPALFFRRAQEHRKPLDYMDIGTRPVIVNSRKLISSPVRNIGNFNNSTTRSFAGSPIVMDSMDAAIYSDKNNRRHNDTNDLFDHLRRSAYNQHGL